MSLTLILVMMLCLQQIFKVINKKAVFGIVESKESIKARMKKEEEELLASMKAEMEAVAKERQAEQVHTDNADSNTTLENYGSDSSVYLKAQREITKKYSNTDSSTEELGNASKQVPKANKSKMPEIRLSITEQSGPLEVFVEEDEEEEDELDDSLGANTIEIAKAITIKAPTPEKEGRETQIENSTSQTIVSEDKDMKVAGDKDASLDAEREMQAAEFDALASIENPAPNVPETTGDILKRLGQGKAMTYKQALKEILSGKDQLEANRSSIVTEAKPTYLKKRSGFMGVFGPKKPKKLNPKLTDERDNVFLMAQLKFDADNETHVIFCKLFTGV